MAKELLPDALWAWIAPLLPPKPPTPKVGRPRVSDWAAPTGILFVPTTGLPESACLPRWGAGAG